MKDFGGFEHNLQSLRTVDLLEESYAEFNGLNLMHETREGILKHCSPKNAELLGDIGGVFEGRQPSLEAQLANLADEIAYNNHDVDDGLRSGLITLEQLEAVPIFVRKRQIVEARLSGAGRAAADSRNHPAHDQPDGSRPHRADPQQYRRRLVGIP
jgi:dGTPase